MAVDPGTVYLVAASIVLITILCVAFLCNGKGDKKERRPAGARPVARPRAENAPPGARRRAPRRRAVVQDDGSDDDVPVMGADEEDGEDFERPEGKIGAKKLRKLQEKAEKRRLREIELQEREEKKEREKKLEEQRKKEEARQKAEEEIKAEEERLRKEEEEKREHEEFLKWKEMFSVEESGESELPPDLDSQSLLQEFIDYIKEMKVVMLEDLAARFDLKTQECIERVQNLLDSEQLMGVIDDRGKFIYITREELESVAKYIRQNGRVSIIELARSSNRLINLTPDNEEARRQLMAVS